MVLLVGVLIWKVGVPLRSSSVKTVPNLKHAYSKLEEDLAAYEEVTNAIRRFRSVSSEDFLRTYFPTKKDISISFYDTYRSDTKVLILLELEQTLASLNLTGN